MTKGRQSMYLADDEVPLCRLKNSFAVITICAVTAVLKRGIIFTTPDVVTSYYSKQ